MNVRSLADRMSPEILNNRKFSLAHLTLLETPPPELIRIAGRAGYDYVGLRLIALGLPGEPRYALHEDAALLRDTKAAIDSSGVRCSTSNSPESSTTVFHRPTCRHSKSPRRSAPGTCCRASGCAIGARPSSDSPVCVMSPGRSGLTVNLEFVSSTDWSTLDGSLDVVTSSGPRQRRNHDRYATLPPWATSRSTISIASRRPGLTFAHVSDDRQGDSRDDRRGATDHARGAAVPRRRRDRHRRHSRSVAA